jgi:hypothetical protein
MRVADIMTRQLKTIAQGGTAEGTFLHAAIAPLIYSLLLPLVLFDAWVTVYQRICFPLYGIAPVRRRRYFVFDRHTLTYLSAVEKINCTFCSYANGVIAYTREVASRTEHYWCPIKHAQTPVSPHGRYERFAEFGDSVSYRGHLADVRRTSAGRSTSHEPRAGEPPETGAAGIGHVVARR